MSRKLNGGGSVAALWITMSYVFATGYLIYTGKSLLTGSSDAIIGILIVNIIAIVLSLFFAWRIWKKAVHISAIILLLWIVIEVIEK